MLTYYNENDSFASAWLAGLMQRGLIANGCLDERDIQAVQPSDLEGYGRAHFFAGIGGWDYALQLAGWPADRPVWTGSCPCQPFSSAGKGEGFNDTRHLWPTWFRLIRECRPPVVFGEQVASAAGLAWFDHVAADLEAEAYAVGAADLCAAGVGAPHIRQRLVFVAHTTRLRFNGLSERRSCGSKGKGRLLQFEGGLSTLSVDDTNGTRRSQRLTSGDSAGTESAEWSEAAGGGALGGLADSDGGLTSDRDLQRSGEQRQQPEDGRAGSAVGDPDERASPGLEIGVAGSRAPSPWSDAVLLPCRDGKLRPIPAQPALFPLAPGLPRRVGILRGSGNSIVPQAAATFIRAFLEVS